jgi:Domain of unknown function (DUF397)
MTLPHDLSEMLWRKSSRSQEHGACVELARLPGSVAVRDSKNPTTPMLTFEPSSWRAFTQRVRSGSLDI